MNDPELTDRIIEEGQPLVRAIEAVEIITPTGRFVRAITWLQLQAHRRRLRGIISLAPAWLGEEILSASQNIESASPALCLTRN